GAFLLPAITPYYRDTLSLQSINPRPFPFPKKNPPSLHRFLNIIYDDPSRVRLPRTSPLTCCPTPWTNFRVCF
ncbi:hypothetical protein VIGAN_UM082100, partial [Vigna angularis var. angularis]